MSAGKRAIKTLTRAELSVTGSDAVRFLNGMCTADMLWAWESSQKLGRKIAGHAFFLSLKGRPVSPGTFVLDASMGEILWSLPVSSASETSEMLEHHVIADDVELKFLTPETRSCIWQGAGSFPAPSVERLEPRVPEARDELFVVEEDSEGSWRIPWASRWGGVGEVWYQSTESARVSSVAELSEEEWTQWRLRVGWPEWNRDYDANSLILEYPFAEAISFHKGCYLGQEVVARATYRGKVPRSFCAFRGRAPLALGWIYAQEDLSRPIGKITTVSGQEALGVMRLSESAKALVQVQEGHHVVPLELREEFTFTRESP